ncbi:Extra-cytoplasmic solute receptor [Roseomonas mucosa]|uniref:Argininosuccinate lyase n=1 Tax=Roseomonas mucosa TaxID=207340 RepID=A0A1S8DCD6_9PROT|nr:MULTISPECIES: tripartite tricarboxylate transporter substrate binding protein [Roseomonas]MBS5901883.1 tripartite tricarboxylate transporter substrate binding protein [Acetobacteraceae bacterium]ATR20997.1 tripartite tricarboxylate transporter substrate binding protein [Roseomonas sp. FDAARGOS_362]AWV22439.1 Extra-cytoplasmic solute receptor [Roseomonas mucosa]MCG7350186.1 tripartite tricarboxylate transporter substrate binding protein [Roseomonas mucosa]MCG7355035.1 tripartite tricarboxyla
MTARRTRRATLLAACGTLLGLAWAGAQPVQAQDKAAANYPDRPIRVIVPFGAGGTTDLVARLVGQTMSKRLGQPVVVENRAGAGGNIGSDVCAKSTPDGYTLCVGTISSHAINASIYPKMPFDSQKDFAPVALLATQPNILVVANNVPASNVTELVALMKAKPGSFDYGSSGVGTSIHLAGVLFLQMTGTDAVHVPYRSSGQIMTEMLGGSLPMSFDNFSSAWPHVRDGRLKAIGVGSRERMKVAPDVPAVAETLPGFESLSWHGLFAPAGTPPAIVEKLNREALASVRSPEVMARYEELGISSSSFTPAEFKDFVAAETKRWGDVARAANVKVE